MKKSYFLLFGFLFGAFSTQAQTEFLLHSFEDDFIYEYSEVAWHTRSNPEGLHYEVDIEIGDNPDKSGINKSDKVLWAKTRENGQIGWWENTFIIEFEPGYPAIDETTRYLHFKFLRTIDDGVGWRVEVNGQILASGNTVANKWVDLVFDLDNLTTKGDGVTRLEMIMRTDWGNTSFEQTAYYIDDIILSDSDIPRGDYDFIEGNSILNFEDEGDSESKMTLFSGGTASILHDNPLTTGLNTTNKCAYYEGDSSEWWHGITFNFTRYIKVTDENRFFHFMMRRDDIGEAQEIDVTYTMLGGTSQISIFDQGLGTGIKLNEEWTEYVVELRPGLITKMEFKCKGDNAYLDELWLDDDPNPREVIKNSLSIKSVNQNYLISSTAGQIQVKSVSGELLHISLYSLTGEIVDKAVANDYAAQVTNGIYLLNINGQVEKVIVR